MANDYFNVSGTPGTSANLSSAAVRAEFTAIAAGFAKLPTLGGNAGLPVAVNTGGTGIEAVNAFAKKVAFNGSASELASKLTNVLEPITISATAATGTINYDITTQSVLYYTTNASASWTLNFRASSGTSLNAAMAIGESITVTFAVTQGASAFYNNVVQVDGGAVTPKWQGGTAPAAGNASGIDVYSYTIIKTGNAAFTVLASQTQFK